VCVNGVGNKWAVCVCVVGAVCEVGGGAGVCLQAGMCALPNMFKGGPYVGHGVGAQGGVCRCPCVGACGGSLSSGVLSPSSWASHVWAARLFFAIGQVAVCL